MHVPDCEASAIPEQTHLASKITGCSLSKAAALAGNCPRPTGDHPGLAVSGGAGFRGRFSFSQNRRHAAGSQRPYFPCVWTPSAGSSAQALFLPACLPLFLPPRRLRPKRLQGPANGGRKQSPRGERDAAVSEQVVPRHPPSSRFLFAVTKKYPDLLPEGRPPSMGDPIPAGSTLPLWNAVENTARGTRVGGTHWRRDSSHRRSANDAIPDECSLTPESAVQQGSPKYVFDC